MNNIFVRRAVQSSTPWILAAVLTLAVTFPLPVFASDCAKPWDALIKLAAVQIDRVFGDVAASTHALAEEYAALSDSVPPPTQTEKSVWMKSYQAKGKTVGFQTWPGNLDSSPSFQDPYPAFYDYRGTAFTDDTYRQLEIFKRLTPVFRAAYRSFGFSWVYVTTSQGKMMIYPYLPLNEAVNNMEPTKQVYYTSADFKNRDVGWTLPYLDLVGAGMMITVSDPIYKGDTLLGVVSRDITLKQLSREVLNQLVVEEGTVAFIIDSSGLVIGVSDPSLSQELDLINSKNAAAVLHYRTEKGLKQIGSSSAMASGTTWINQLSEELIAQEANTSASSVIRFVQDGREVLATRTARTGWYVVSAVPQ